MEKVKLGQLTNIKTGRLDVNAENPNGKYPFFTCSKNHTYIDEYAFEGESVLVAGNGDLNVKYYNGKFNAYQRTYVIQANENLNGKFLYYFLDSYVEKLREQSIGGVIKYIKLGNLTDAEIPLPNLATQQRIAAILDQADAIIQNNRAIVQKYDALTQSLFLDMFGDPVKNEKGWKIDILKNLCLKITDGTHFSPEPQKDGFPYVTAKHVKSCGLDFYSKPTFVSEEAHSEIYKRCTPEFGDVLYIKDGATTGIACLNTFNEPISLLSSLALLKPNYKILNNYYLCYWLNNSKVKLKLLGEFMSGAAIQRYTLTKINSFQLIIPPIELQYQFAERVAMIEAQKQQAQLELAKSEELFASLLQRAFNGELN